MIVSVFDSYDRQYQEHKPSHFLTQGMPLSWKQDTFTYNLWLSLFKYRTVL